jgi:hypothetical protein
MEECARNQTSNRVSPIIWASPRRIQSHVLRSALESATRNSADDKDDSEDDAASLQSTSDEADPDASVAVDDDDEDKDEEGNESWLESAEQARLCDSFPSHCHFIRTSRIQSNSV